MENKLSVELDKSLEIVKISSLQLAKLAIKDGELELAAEHKNMLKSVEEWAAQSKEHIKNYE